MELPLELLPELFSAIVAKQDLGLIGRFARLCRYSAYLVKKDAMKLAKSFAVKKNYGDMSVRVLPNGIRHGIAKIGNYYENYLFGRKVSKMNVNGNKIEFIGPDYVINIERAGFGVRSFKYRGPEGRCEAESFGKIASDMTRAIIYQAFLYILSHLGLDAFI
nr:hypothetical protein K-LCC10_0267 [Kaumoebavirus]